MNPLWWLGGLGLCAVVALLVSLVSDASRERLPRDFDFDLYKTRELNIRGLFDKTKWL